MAEWLQDESQKLRDFYPKAKSTAELIEMFPRHSVSGIQTRAARLGLHCGYDTHYSKRKTWSGREIAFLKQAYPDVNACYNDNIVANLGRTPCAIRAKAKQLAIKRTCRNKLALDNSLIEKLYCDEKLGTPEIATRLNCSTTAISKRLQDMGYAMRGLSEAIKLAHTKKPQLHGEGSPNWKGGRMISHGYAMVLKPNYPRADSHGYVSEHLLVWEETHDKPLPKGWTVHHLNGIKNDNRPSNLLGLPCKKHALIIPELNKKVRELEIENRQLRKVLEDSQMILYMNEN